MKQDPLFVCVFLLIHFMMTVLNKHFEPVLVCCGFFFETQKHDGCQVAVWQLLGSCQVAARKLLGRISKVEVTKLYCHLDIVHWFIVIGLCFIWLQNKQFIVLQHNECDQKNKEWKDVTNTTRQFTMSRQFTQSCCEGPGTASHQMVTIAWQTSNHVSSTDS